MKIICFGSDGFSVSNVGNCTDSRFGFFDTETESLMPPVWMTNEVVANTGPNLLFSIPLSSAVSNRFFRLDLSRM